jgi:hypothetical protein
MIIETCPECGHDLQNLMLTTYPPIPQKQCFNCGWTWTGKQEEVIRVPFSSTIDLISRLEQMSPEDINNCIITALDESDIKYDIKPDGTGRVTFDRLNE